MCALAGLSGLREPLMLRVRDEDGSVVEYDLVAGAIDQNVRGRDDGGGTAVRVHQLVSDADFAHRCPAGRRRQRRIERQRLALRRSTGNDDELAWVQTVGELVEIAEAGRDA